jgi:FkbM family methyltransferase
MQTGPSIFRRLARFLQLLPETTLNSLRFRSPFLLPRWFCTPREIRVAGKNVALEFPPGENTESDFIACFLRNSYGLRHKLGEVRSILDVGANVGFFSLAARSCYPGAVIHAYEPNPRVLPHLCANTKRFDISVFPEAVGSDKGFVTILDEGPSDEARTRKTLESSMAIRQVSLATAIERIGGSLDLLKLDCEGAEWDILASNDCWHKVRHIRMEIHFFGGETLEQAKDALKRIGFTVLYTDEMNPQMATIWARRG